MTYAELDRRTDRLANALAGLGYGDGSRIAVLSETRPEFCELYVACAKLGVTLVTLVTLNIRLLPYEIADCIDLAGPEALFTSALLAPAAEAFRPRTPSIRRRYCFDDFPDSDYGDYVDLVAGGAAGLQHGRSSRLSAADVPRSVTGKILRGDLVQRPTTPDQVVKVTSA